VNHKSICIIGAGPAGLAIAGRLSHLGWSDYVILESEHAVGSSWRRHYDRLHLHTVKQWSHLPHLPFPKDYPLYVSKQQLVDYLESYQQHFDLQLQYGVSAHLIKKQGDQWLVKTDKEDYLVDHAVIATGVNKVPRVPQWPGQESFRGNIVHTKYYKNPKPYLNKKVLVVGMGNTGAEVALDLSEHGVKTYVSVRSPIAIVPRDLNGRPVQVTAKMLAKIPFGLGDWLGSQIRKVYFGNLEPYGLPISKVHPTVQLRETGKTPVVDIGTVDAIKNGHITVCPNIKSIGPNYVVTIENQEIEIDDILLATGYTAELKNLIPSVSNFLDKYDLPNSPIGEGTLSNLYFIGFDNYKVGGILGTISTDSKVIVDDILKN